MSIYIKSSDIPGAVTTKGFEQTFEVLSVQYGVSRAIGSRAGVTTSDSSTATVSEIVCTKILDAASLKLFSASLNGAILPSMTLSMVRQDAAAGPTTFLELDLGNVIVSNYQLNGVGGTSTASPTETFNLNYGTITAKVTLPNADGSAGTPASYGYNVGTMSKM